MKTSISLLLAFLIAQACFFCLVIATSLPFPLQLLLCLSVIASAFWIALFDLEPPQGSAKRRSRELARIEQELEMTIEFWEYKQAIAGTLSITYLRQVMSDRKKTLWKGVRTNCHWFTGNAWLKCTPNPQGACDNCPHFQNRFAPHRTRNQPRNQPRNPFRKRLP